MTAEARTETTLARVCSSVDYGYTASACEDPRVGPKFLRITDIVPESLVWDNVPHCEIEPRRHAQFMLEDGDIVVARTGATVGYAKQIWAPPSDVTFASYLVRFRPDPKRVDVRFIGMLVQSTQFKRWVQSMAGGSAQPNANAKVLGSFPLRLPSVGQQRAISGALWAFDDLIENNRRRIEILEETARLLYREWFVHFRYPGHEGVELVDSELGPIPEGWALRPFSAAVEINPRVKVEAGVAHPFITMADVSVGSMICFPSETKAGVSGSKFHNGDTVFARITPCLENGKTGLVLCLEDGQVARGSTEFLVFRGRMIGSEHTYLVARDPALRDTAQRSMSGASGRQRVQNACFDSYLIPVPDGATGGRFSETVGPLFALAANLAKQNRVLREARDLLLPRLVSGELDVSDLDLDGVLA